MLVGVSKYCRGFKVPKGKDLTTVNWHCANIMTTIVRIRSCSVIRAVMIASLESSYSREFTCERRLLAKKVAFVR